MAIEVNIRRDEIPKYSTVKDQKSQWNYLRHNWVTAILGRVKVLANEKLNDKDKAQLVAEIDRRLIYILDPSKYERAQEESTKLLYEIMRLDGKD